jgi:hypothetical protein
MAPASAACREAGLPWLDYTDHVVGYPPDTPLPESLAGWLDTLTDLMTVTRSKTAAERRFDAFHQQFLAGEPGLRAANILLNIGDREGLALRRQIWERHEDHWQLSALTTDPSHRYGLPVHRIKSRFWAGGEAFLTRAIKEGEPSIRIRNRPAPLGPIPWITYAELARVCTLAAPALPHETRR